MVAASTLSTRTAGTNLRTCLTNSSSPAPLMASSDPRTRTPVNRSQAACRIYPQYLERRSTNYRQQRPPRNGNAVSPALGPRHAIFARSHQLDLSRCVHAIPQPRHLLRNRLAPKPTTLGVDGCRKATTESTACLPGVPSRRTKHGHNLDLPLKHNPRTKTPREAYQCLDVVEARLKCRNRSPNVSHLAKPVIAFADPIVRREINDNSATP